MHVIGACPNMRKSYTAQTRKPNIGKNRPPQKGVQHKRKFPQEIEVDHHVGKGHRVNNKDAPIKDYRRKGNKHVVKPAGKTAKQAAKSSGCLLMAGVMLTSSWLVVKYVIRTVV